MNEWDKSGPWTPSNQMQSLSINNLHILVWTVNDEWHFSCDDLGYCNFILKAKNLKDAKIEAIIRSKKQVEKNLCFLRIAEREERE